MADYIGETFGAIAGVYAEGVKQFGPLPMQVLFTCIGIVIYAMFSGSFYWKLSRREIFKVDIRKSILGGTEGTKRAFESFVFILKYTLIFPVITLLWTGALTIFIAAVSRNLTVESIAIISISIVAATRIVSYYSEEIAVDLSKLLPLVLLGIALTDPTAISAQTIVERGYTIAAIAEKFVPAFVALILLEWLLRIGLIIKRKALGQDEKNVVKPDDEVDLILEDYEKRKKAKEEKN